MTLVISAQHLQQIRDHAVADYPQECCGLIVGTLKGNVKQANIIYPMQNAWTEDLRLPLCDRQLSDRPHSQQDRYWIDPAAMLSVIKQSREQGYEMIGVYHSHPDHPAVPSECDRRLAWPQYAYVIVSVAQGVAEALDCWCLDEQGNFQAESIETLAD